VLSTNNASFWFSISRLLKTIGSGYSRTCRQNRIFTDTASDCGARFLTAGDDALADYEILELILFGALRQGDMKPLAKTPVG
jgi:hypothetical protein